MSLWGSRDRVADKPKWANTNNTLANQSNYGNTYGVTVAETGNASTKVKGIHAGWVSVKAYADCHGNLRYKGETLVAMSDIDVRELHYSSVSATGTVTTSSSSATVTGSGTAFTTELAAGTQIRIDTSSPLTVTVASIANNTSLTLTGNAGVTKSNKTFVRFVANTANYTDDTDSNVFFQGA